VDCFQKTYCWSLARDHAVARPRPRGAARAAHRCPPVQRRTVRRGDRSGGNRHRQSPQRGGRAPHRGPCPPGAIQARVWAEDLDVADRRCWDRCDVASRHAIARRCGRDSARPLFLRDVRRGGGDVRSRPRARRRTSGPAPYDVRSTGWRARWTVRPGTPPEARAAAYQRLEDTNCVSPPSATRLLDCCLLGGSRGACARRRGAGVAAALAAWIRPADP